MAGAAAGAAAGVRGGGAWEAGGVSVLHEEWKPGRWWRVLGPDGDLWCETSDEAEARERARPGDRLERQWVLLKEEWRPADSQADT